MPIVTVDPQRRIYLPKELGFQAKKALILPRGDTYLLIPIPEEITPIDTEKTISELKKQAEEKAKQEILDANRF